MRYIKKERKGSNWERPQADNRIVHVASEEKIYEYSKVAEHKVNVQRFIEFLYTSNKDLENKIFK